jgi:multiple sugar transport system substrate-binding protein
MGNFAENGWIVPVETFTGNPDLADPDLDMADFFPLVLTPSASGTA